jgi:hypothetical protein
VRVSLYAACTMTDREKLDTLHRRLLDEQRRMILAAANVDALPSSAVLGRLADLELAIAAVEAMIEDDAVG